MRLGIAGALACTGALPCREARAVDEAACIKAAEAAQQERQAGHLTAALDHLTICAREECPLVVRKDCVSWLGEVEQTLPSIVVHASDARGRDVVGVHVSIDGKVVRDRLDGRAIAVDPGQHQVRMEVRGAPAVEQTVLVSEGEKDRPVRMRFDGRLTVEGEPEAQPRGASPRTIIGWSLVGLAGASLAAFGVLELVAQNEYSTLQGGCGRTRTCTDAQTSPIQTKFDLAKAALVVGGVSLAVGVPLLLFGGKPDAPRAAVTAAAGESSASVRVIGAF